MRKSLPTSSFAAKLPWHCLRTLSYINCLCPLWYFNMNANYLRSMKGYAVEHILLELRVLEQREHEDALLVGRAALRDALVSGRELATDVARTSPLGHDGPPPWAKMWPAWAKAPSAAPDAATLHHSTCAMKAASAMASMHTEAT